MSKRGGKVTFVLIAILVTAIIGGLLSLVFSRFVVGNTWSGKQHNAVGQVGTSRPAETASPDGGGGKDTSESQ